MAEKPKLRVLLASFLGMSISSYAYADLTITTTTDPTTLVNMVMDPNNTGIVVNSVTVFGGSGQIATFTNGLSVPGFITFEEGIILSSGSVSAIAGPNDKDGMTGADQPTLPGADGDADFNTLSDSTNGTFDAAYIEINFTPSQEYISGSFVFASEEYNEYAPPVGNHSSGNTYYDVMAFFVNGVNYSITAAGAHVSINSVNESLNAADFYSNDLEDDGEPSPYNIEPDGFTRRLTWTAPVNPGQENVLKFGVADGGDDTYDSWLLVDKYAFEIAPEPTSIDLALEKSTLTSGGVVGDPITYQFTVSNVGNGATSREVIVTDTLPAGITVNGGIAEAMIEVGENESEWTCQSDANTPQTVSCKSNVVIQSNTGNNFSSFAFETDAVPSSLANTSITNTAVVSSTDTDANASNNSASISTAITLNDVTAPELVISGAPTVVDGTDPFTLNIEINEVVSGFTLDDVIVTGGSASNLVTVGTKSYTVDVTPDGSSDISVVIPSSSATDDAGNGNNVSNTTTTMFSSSAVELTIVGAPDFVANTDPLNITFQFSEDVVGFELTDIQLENATLSDLVAVDASTYTVQVIPDGTGDISIVVPGAAATDTALFDPTVQASAAIELNVSAPTVSISGAPASTNTNTPYTATFEFSEAVTEFVISDIAVKNGAVSDFTEVSDTTYTALVTPNGNGNIQVGVPAEVAVDIAGNSNQAATSVTTLYDDEQPTLAFVGVPARVNSTAIIPVTFEFSEDVVGFTQSSVSVSNGALSNFIAVDGHTYTADLTPSSAGDIQLSVAAGAVQDTLNNDNLAASKTTAFDMTPPVISISTVAGDNIINAIEDDSDVVISGTVTGLEVGQTVQLTLNGVDYTATPSTGNWSVQIPAADIQALPSSNTITADATDLAGNAATTATLPLQHDGIVPALPTVDSILANTGTPVITGTAIFAAGEMLEVTINGVSYTAGDGNLVDNGDSTWSLTLPTQSSLLDGIYSVEAVVSDLAGNSATDSSTTELTIDTIAPATPLVSVDLQDADDTGSSSVDNITFTTTPTFTVPADTATAGDRVELFANAQSIGTAVVAADGSFTVLASSMADGNYAIRYSTSDTAGNTSTLSPTLNVTIDTTLTAPVLDSPIATDNIINAAENKAVLLTGTAEAMSNVQINIDDGVNSPLVINVTTANNGKWTLLGNEVDLSSLQDGTLSIDVQATDVAGNVQSMLTSNVTLGATAPAVPTIDAQTINTTTPSITGTATVSAGDTLQVTLNGKTYLSSGSDLTANGNGTWSLLVPATDALAQATYNVQVSVTDVNGNKSTDTSSAELVVDITAPLMPSIESQIANSTTPTLVGTAEVAAGETLSVQINGVTYTSEDGNLSVGVNKSWSLLIPPENALPEGVYAVDVSISDTAGNITSDISSNELEVDITAPASPAVNALLSNSATPTLTGSAVVAANEYLSVSVDGKVYSAGDGSLTDNGNGTWELVIPTVNAINDGSYDVTVSVTDSAGNVATESTSAELLVDTTAPALPITAPDLIALDDSGESDVDNKTSTVTPTFSLPASTGTSGETVTLYANNVEVGTTTVAADGSFSVTSSTLSDGNYAIKYTLTDSLGNQSEFSPVLNISMDTATSAPTIKSPIATDNIINTQEDSAVLISGTAESGSAITVTFADGVNPDVQLNVVTDSNGAWSLLGTEADISSLNNGVISIDVVATDKSGNSASATQVQVTHTTVVPVLTVNAVSVDNTINAIEDNADITLSGATTDVEDGQIVQLTLNGKTYQATVTSGVWSVVIPALDAQVLPANSTLSAGVKSVAGNAAANVSFSIIHDAIEPEISLSAISTDNKINASEDDTDITVSGTSVGLEDGQNVTVLINGSSYSGAVSADTWSVAIAAVDAQALPASNTLTVNASDLAGNAAVELSQSVVHDIIVPVVVIVTAPIANGANSSDYVVAGSCSTGDPEVTVSISGATPATRNVLCNASNEWSAGFDVSSIADGTGVIAIAATQTDSAGNVSTVASLSVDKNTTTPSITITTVALDDYINALEDDSDVLISGITTNIEDAQIASITLNSIIYDTTVAGNMWSVSIPQADVLLLSSTESITANVSNLASTAAEQAERTIIYDTTPPTVPVVTALQTNVLTPTISGTATLVAGDILTVTLNTITYTAGDGQLVDNGDGTWTLEVPGANALTEGSYDVVVTIEDVAGNTISESSSNELLIDTTAPSTPLVALDLDNTSDTGVSDSDDVTQTVASEFSAAAGSGVSGDEVIILANGVEVGTATVQADGSFSVTTALPGDDDYEISYTYTDPAGNTSLPAPIMSMTLDTTVSKPLINEPVAEDQLVNAAEQAALLVSGTAEPMASIEVTVDDGTNPAVTQTVVADVNGDWTLTGNELDISTLNEGALQVTAVSTDLAGNVASADASTIELDRTLVEVPTVVVIASNSPVVVIQGAANLDTTDTLTVQVNGVVYTAGAGALVDNGDGTWTLSIPAEDALADGNYSVVATITDAAGNTASDTSSDELLIDTVIPTAATVQAQYTNSTTPTLMGSVTLLTGESLSVTVDGITYTTADELIVSGDGSWSLTIPIANALSGGIYDIQSTVSDLSGNTASDTSSSELIIDVTAPTVPTVQASSSAIGEAIITGTATLLNGETLTVEVDGKSYTLGDEELSYKPSGVWTLTIPAVNALSDGSYQVQATVTDLAGNSSLDVSSSELNVDSQAPQAPTVNALVSNSLTPTITGTAVLSGSEYLVVSVGGVQYSSSGSDLTLNVDGTWTLVIPAANALAQASYDIQAQAFDSTGNSSIDVSADEVVIDTTVPAVPTINALKTNVALPTISGTVELAAGETLSVAVNGVTYTEGSQLVINGNVWSLTLPTGAELTEGVYTVAVQVSDTAGNVSEDASVGELTIDTQAPTISVQAVTGDNIINATEDDSAVVISGSTTGVEDGEYVSVTIDSLTYTATVAGGVWSLNLPTADVQAISENAQLSASVSDAAGNVSTPATLTLVHDTEAPKVAITVVPQINTINSSSYTVSGTCAIGEGVVTVVISSGLPATQEVSCNASGQWSATVDVSAAVEGDTAVDITASQTDAAGNTSTGGSQTLSKDTTPPTIVITDNGSSGDNAWSAIEGKSVQVSGATSGAENYRTVLVTFSDGVNDITTSAALVNNNWIADTVDISSLNSGSITLSATVTDVAGNTAIPASESITLDKEVPVLTALDYGPSNVSMASFSGTSDLSDGGTVIVEDSSAIEYCSATVSAGLWSCDSTVSLNDGTTHLFALSSDAAGNSAIVPFTGIISNTIDTDGDGISDVIEGSGDADGDGIPNIQDTDSDGDGIDDRIETKIDTDGDGIRDFLDIDADNDGMLDSLEGQTDTDGDGVANFLDLDSDNDGVTDAIEAGVDATLDVDNNGRLEGAVGTNGLLDAIETAVDSGVVDYNADTIADNPLDSDNDTVADYLDIDSDNDGVTDVIEAGASEGDTVGVIAKFADNNGDGLHDPLAFTSIANTDTDADGTSDRLSLDSDGDGINDIIEAGGVDDDADGMLENFIDANSDGLHDPLFSNPYVLIDSDADEISDRIDDDSDGDGISDAIESNGSGGALDTDGDGIANHLDLDSDDDTLSDEDEGMGDIDGDGIADYIDSNILSDTDNDGITDASEGAEDLDDDGLPNLNDTDSDGDGIDDIDEGAFDSDGDGLDNYKDTDSDNDGIPDALEGVSDSDGDGKPDYLDTDSDDDGIADAIEAGANPLVPIDSDGDTVPDYIDDDADDDGIADIDEGAGDQDGDGTPNYLDLDSENDGIQDIYEDGYDDDADGLISSLDNDSDGDGILDSVEGRGDVDQDYIPNFQDLDSDEDGIDDSVEDDIDSDGDGIGNFVDMDSDGDTIPDAKETAADHDGDLIPNYLDLDSDNDGIADAIEVGGVPSQATDTDLDGVPDYLSDDSDSDGISDAYEGAIDNDKDGVADYIDDDSDADGIPDLLEGTNDVDGDGVPNYADLDSDGDGINDVVEAGLIPSSPKDTDKDGTPDYLDLDSDGDGISDAEEGSTDSDGDGIPDENDEDANGDGLPDIGKGTADFDKDGIPNYLDSDIDGDGISNTAEGNIDTDGDGLANYLDTDSDGDGVPDVIERVGDGDGDGIANYLDTDSDNDGISDKLELGSDPFAPLDSDGDGIADFLDTDSDGDSIVDKTEGTLDSDGDGIPNYLDTDSDADGISDQIEGIVDSDADGLANYLDSDSDNDGLGDILEGVGDSDADALPNFLDADSDGDGIADSKEGAADSDGDGIADFLDTDSDGDGIPDVVEKDADVDNDGIANYIDIDSDGDTVVDAVEAGDNPLSPVDSDSDTLPDYLDTDSDNDGISDAEEGLTDSDGDGIPDARDPDSNNDGITDVEAGYGDLDGDGLANFLDADIDGDGIPNLAEGNVDTDGDGTANYRDSDSDSDGIPDSEEGSIDSDGDGKANFLDTDADGDGIPDTAEGVDDADNDKLRNFLDTDSDNDQIPDVVEGEGDSDGDGIADYLDIDSDNDGIYDIFETSADTDKDGIPNYLDADSDADGITDQVEAGAAISGFNMWPVDTDGDGEFDFLDSDSDGDNITDKKETDADNDSDGIPNYLDADSDGDGTGDLLESSQDQDGDGIPNYLDTDADGDGIDDVDEGASDADGDGVLNYLDIDADGDGITDAIEGSDDADGDNIANYLDIDSDSDGISDKVEVGSDPSSPVDTDADGTPDYLDSDSNNDGISDLEEGSDDLDGDGTPNDQDLDDNNDGIPDSMLDANDEDNDGIPNNLDNDIDGDGIPNKAEGLTDPDGDGIPNFLDTDSDNDGIADSDEKEGDFDSDGLPDFIDIDSDGDGISDYIEGNVDSDGDGVPDYLDLDSDGDGIRDIIEGNEDSDGDGTANYLDDDSDDDGILDRIEGSFDIDGDGLGNFIDTDSDGDGISDVVEAGSDPSQPVDTDGDGTRDMYELDSDNDGILDSEEGIEDTDGDGIPNSSDLDSNNDGILDAELGAGDIDNDSIPDFLDGDIDGDGIPNGLDGSDDADSDGLPNYADMDSDNDGIPDVDEGYADADADGIPNFLDLDSDGDTLLDAVENQFDSDGDGVPNFLDSDSDNDGIPDSTELSFDKEEDNTPNYIDTDSDGDGILDAKEGSFDFDGDGLPNYLDKDSDGDGIADKTEGTVDSDGDGVANYLDDDTDGDGISDKLETASDDDSDGLSNFIDDDSDDDGIPDAIETAIDTDGDGLGNFIDTDSDNDGILDSIEVGALPESPQDTDGDGIPNYIDTDSDGDGVSDADEGLADTDADGIPDYLDIDSDGDGIPDVVEGNADTDGDGIIDSQDLDSDGDGINDNVEAGGSPSTPLDTDGDGVPDFKDLDSDGDGIPDSNEGTTDNDGDGIPNNIDDDSNNDGILDALVGEGDDDGDGIPNNLDADIDGDGIPNTAEGAIDSDGDGQYDFADTDSDNDGLPDALETTGDTDGDGILDYLDSDSDGDGVPDNVEGSGDTDNDGVADYIDSDSDNDGIDDKTEGTVDTDNDGIPDYLDTDSDGDGISDAQEGVDDVDGDGIPNYLDLDSDGDGIFDTDEGSSDNDGDGIPNALDTDSDGDGISDTTEGVDDSDSDGVPDYLDTDSDGDGINDKVENAASGGGSQLIDTDGDGIPDYKDTDSDNDGIGDAFESTLDSDGDGVPDMLDQDANNDGILDSEVGNKDTDGDGIVDALDDDIDGDGIANKDEGSADTDGDGIPNYADTDSDNDGIPDALEGNTDTDGDGIADFEDTDSDGDGITDKQEAGADALNPSDSDGDSIPDYLDGDSDNDGIADAVEGASDTDKDGIANYLDGDSDNDGISDGAEGQIDTDGDGIANFLDNDADSDGITDNVEVGEDGSNPVDTDGDGMPDYLDTDSNNNGTADSAEGVLDSDGDGINDDVDDDDNNDGIPDALVGDGDDDGDGIPNKLDADIDGDGISNSDEGTIDSDGDGIADFLDTDSDNDGISDKEEGQGDQDADGVADYLDTDADGDGIADSEESTIDSDGDGIANYLDTDSDNDGIADSVEGSADTDGDGIANNLDDDSDGDGISDADEGSGDSDGDTVPAFLDADSDGDGIADSVEGNLDTDGDGVPNFRDTDSDGDGITDDLEGLEDSDADGQPDYLDTDSDNDGVSDAQEGRQDADGDGIPNYKDSDSSSITDSDSDGLSDVQEGSLDNDGDGIPNAQDTDSDGDGIPDFVEGGNDSDGDGVPDYLDLDSDGDGISDRVEVGSFPSVPIDNDGDGTPDYLDLDSDGDGIGDELEGITDRDGDGVDDELDPDANNDGILDSLLGDGDTDGDGVPDRLDDDIDGDGLANTAEGMRDTDGDGILDFMDTDADNDGIPDSEEGSADTDGDGIPNFRDTDSDGDGIADRLERGTTSERALDSDNDGIADYLDPDSDNDGISDALEGAVDTDGDGILDYQDTDSDNDGVEDRVSGFQDADGNGFPDSLVSGVDSDNDGIEDTQEGVGDRDGDGIPNYLDTDSDGDGIEDSVEGQADSDNDGLADYLDDDADNDGIPDALEGEDDADGDGIPNFRDTDSDGDGLSDAAEALLDLDADGKLAFLDDDSDGDGIADSLESLEDVDGDGVANYLDTDADGDGIADSEEGSGDTDGDLIADYLDTDSDNDLVPDALEGTGDADGDGTPDYKDRDSASSVDADGDGIPDAVEGTGDADGDGIANNLDTDSDNDGISDRDEGAEDTDGDGTPNYIDTDSDGDGIDDVDEGSNDSDGDGVINALDGDADNDGIPDSVESGRDSDGDGIDDALDRDSDNDGLSDYFELTGHDSGADGLIDGFSDQNGNGIHDLFETKALTLRDSDKDGVPNHMDIDSDNDGLTDAYEADTGDADRDGRIDRFLDQNGNGLDDAIELSAMQASDTDGDGVADYLDTDSDQDGIPDLVEARGDGTDRDGYIDAFVDSNGDGMDDALALAPWAVVDSDGDGIPDYLEIDSDNDGVSDLLETGGTDTDGDGVVDSMADRDKDLIPDVVDVDYTGGSDIDGDGIDDTADSDFVSEQDDDQDGIINSRDPDSDGNGYADSSGNAVELGAALPDSNGDNIPDYQQAADEEPVKSGISGSGGGCTVTTNSDKAVDPLLLMMVAIAALVALLRKTANPACVVALSASLVATAISFSDVAEAQESKTQFKRSAYVAIGGGASMLNPDTEGTPWELTSSGGGGFQLSGGMDFNKWLTAELHANSLGEAGLTQRANADTTSGITYSTFGASLLAYLPMGGEVAARQREGLAGYVRIGAGMLSSSATTDALSHEQVNGMHILLGLGAEYAMDNGFGVRGEMISFDTDAQLVQLALVYRFGMSSNAASSGRQRATTSSTEKRPTVASAQAAQPSQSQSRGLGTGLDTDFDGVVQNRDKCPSTVSNTPVDRDGCAIFNGVLNGVTFANGSEQLTSEGQETLMMAAQQLQRFPNMKLQVHAHTNNTGGAQVASNLSRKRVVSVANYLISQGVAKNRLAARAFGDTQPVASNSTAQGKALNQRIEFFVVK